MSGGIGLFLAFIGFQTSEGVGLVAFGKDTLVKLAGCPEAQRRFVDPNGDAYSCTGGVSAACMRPASVVCCFETLGKWHV